MASSSLTMTTQGCFGMNEFIKQILVRVVARWLDQHLHDLFSLHRQLADLEKRVGDLEGESNLESLAISVQMDNS